MYTICINRCKTASQQSRQLSIEVCLSNVDDGHLLLGADCQHPGCTPDEGVKLRNQSSKTAWVDERSQNKKGIAHT
eukprot:1816476-Amphidinium_carterae.1